MRYLGKLTTFSFFGLHKGPGSFDQSCFPQQAALAAELECQELLRTRN